MQTPNLQCEMEVTKCFQVTVPFIIVYSLPFWDCSSELQIIIKEFALTISVGINMIVYAKTQVTNYQNRVIPLNEELPIIGIENVSAFVELADVQAA